MPKIALIGRHVKRSDVVTQSELERLAELELVAWSTMHRVQSEIVRLGDRIAAGATVEDGPLYFSTEVGAVMCQSKAQGQPLTSDILPRHLAESAIPPRRKKA